MPFPFRLYKGALTRFDPLCKGLSLRLKIAVIPSFFAVCFALHLIFSTIIMNPEVLKDVSSLIHTLLNNDQHRNIEQLDDEWYATVSGH